MMAPVPRLVSFTRHSEKSNRPGMRRTFVTATRFSDRILIRASGPPPYNAFQAHESRHKTNLASRLPD
jgi:hypothetical protein